MNYNSEINLSNNDSFKKLWVYYFNYLGVSNNSHISYNNINDIKLEWSILNDKFDLINSSEIKITITNGKCEFFTC